MRMDNFGNFRTDANAIVQHDTEHTKYGLYGVAILVVLIVCYFSWQFTSTLATAGLMAAGQDRDTAWLNGHIAAAVLEGSIIALILGEARGWFQTPTQIFLARIGHVALWTATFFNAVLYFSKSYRLSVFLLGDLADSGPARTYAALFFPAILLGTGVLWSTLVLYTFINATRRSLLAAYGHINNLHLKSLLDEAGMEAHATREELGSPDYYELQRRQQRQVVRQKFGLGVAPPATASYPGQTRMGYTGGNFTTVNTASNTPNAGPSAKK